YNAPHPEANMLFRTTLSFLLSLSSLAALAQTPRASETIDVTVTNVDVIVTDSRGNRIRNLTKDDFEIVEKGEKREITNFSAISAEPAPRRILLLFDNSSLTMSNRRLSVDAVRAFLDEELRPTDRVLVATVARSITPKMKMWTNDRTPIDSALASVERETTIGNLDLERRNAEQQIRETMVSDQIASSLPQGSSKTFDALMSIARHYAAQVMATTSETVAALSESVNYFGAGADKKVVVIVGEGLPLYPGSEIWQYVETIRAQAESGTIRGGIRRGARTAMPFNESTSYDLTPAVRAIAKNAYRRGVAMYVINPGRNENAGGAIEDNRVGDNAADFAKVAGNMSGYQLLAKLTGARAFLGAKPPQAMAQIAEDLESYYSLAYRSQVEEHEPGSVVVRTKNDLRVRAVLAGAPLPTESTVEEQVVANHVNLPGGNTLGIVLAADPAIVDGTRRRISLKVMIPVKNLKLVREGDEVTGGFNVYISTGNDHGEVSRVNKQTHQIRWPADALPHLIEKNVTFAVDVVLEQGRDQISVGVMDQRSEQTGYERMTIKG
ncbi:MAG TPA: VWA domain-containing protein, partial [Thermoanaerobaculia bacterium]|nr:VWA domain-containing protein [Thermoanaerobaculia bacterium]